MQTKINFKNWIMMTVVVAAIVIFACLGIGMTYAYFSSKSKHDLGEVTIGTLKLDGVTTTDGADFSLPTEPIVPNQDIANVSLKASVKSNIPYYTRVLVGARVVPAADSEHRFGEACEDYVKEDVEILDIKVGDSIVEGEISGETYQPASDTNLNGEMVYYKLDPSSAPSSLDTAQEETFAIKIKLKDFVGDGFCTYYMEATISIDVRVEVIQADYLENAGTGTLFDNVETMNETWERISPTQTYFSELSWKEIAEISESGEAPMKFRIGDEKSFRLTTTGEEITMVILGFNHDELSDESGRKAGITLGMKNLLSTKFGMNGSSYSSYYNDPGWDKSKMRTDFLAKLFYQLPNDLQGVIKEVNKNTTAGGRSKTIETSKDKLWLLSVSEIHSEVALRFANDVTESISERYVDALIQEGTQYEYYANLLIGDPDPCKNNSSLIKKLNNGTGDALTWYLRSPDIKYNSYYFVENASGKISTSSGDYGVSFCFCI